MNVRISTVLIAICLVVAAGCGQQESRPSGSNAIEERVASADSLTVEVQALAEGVSSRVTLTFRGALEGAQFPRQARHSLFTTNGRYLVWKRTYTDTLYVYDLRMEKVVRKLRIPRGRGPGEFKTLSGATIAADDVVYLAEPNQGKVLRIDVTKGPLEDLTFRESGFRPERVAARGPQLVASGVPSGPLTGLVGVVDADGVFRAADGLDAKKEFERSLSYQAPYLETTRQRAFYLTRYRPRIYVFDPEHNRFVKKVEYGDVEVEMPDPAKTESGAKVYRAPRKVRFFAKRVVGVPDRPDRMLVQAKGDNGQHTFDPSALYEIDVRTETTVAEHDLGLKIESVAAADSSLFVYDDEKREVFEYRLRASDR